MLQRGAPVGHRLQHHESGGASIFGRIMMAESDAERSGQICKSVASILAKSIPCSPSDLKRIKPGARQPTGTVSAGSTRKSRPVKRAVMYDSGVLQRRADDGKHSRHGWLASNVLRPDPVNPDVYRVKVRLSKCCRSQRSPFQHLTR